MLITADNAATLAAKAHEARRANKLAAELKAQEKQIARELAGDGPDEVRMRAIKRLESQLEQIDDKIDEAEEPDDFHKLTTARSKLFEQWRILSGIPMPGSRKPASDKPQRQRAPMSDPT